MKIWDIVKSDFEYQKNKDVNLEEGLRDMALGGLMTIASLGGKAYDKTVKVEPNKIEYSTTTNVINPIIITKFKNKYASILSEKGPKFKTFQNYDKVKQYISSLDVQTINNKIYVVDDRNKRTLIKSTGEDINKEIYKIFGEYIINYLNKNNEDDVSKSLYQDIQDIQDEFSSFLQK